MNLDTLYDQLLDSSKWSMKYSNTFTRNNQTITHERLQSEKHTLTTTFIDGKVIGLLLNFTE